MAVSTDTVLRAVAEFVLADGTLAQMVFHFLSEFVANQSDSTVTASIVSYIEDILTDVATYIDNGVTTNPMETSEVEWDAVNSKWEVTRVLPQDTITWPGTAAGDILPNQIAPVLLASTYRPKTRGRKFIPAFAEAATQGSTLVAGALTALGNAVNDYIADETISANNDLIVGVPSNVTGEFHEFANGDVTDIVGSQRRRKPGVGA